MLTHVTDTQAGLKQCTITLQTENVTLSLLVRATKSDTIGGLGDRININEPAGIESGVKVAQLNQAVVSRAKVTVAAATRSKHSQSGPDLPSITAAPANSARDVIRHNK